MQPAIGDDLPGALKTALDASCTSEACRGLGSLPHDRDDSPTEYQMLHLPKPTKPTFPHRQIDAEQRGNQTPQLDQVCAGSGIRNHHECPSCSQVQDPTIALRSCVMGQRITVFEMATALPQRCRSLKSSRKPSRRLRSSRPRMAMFGVRGFCIGVAIGCRPWQPFYSSSPPR